MMTSYNWLARKVGNEGPSTFTAWYIGDETSLIPYFSGQLDKLVSRWFQIYGDFEGNPV